MRFGFSTCVALLAFLPLLASAKTIPTAVTASKAFLSKSRVLTPENRPSLDETTSFKDATSTKLPSRGGACSDADSTVFFKVAASAAFETAALLTVFYAGKEVAENTSIGEIFGLPISYWASILFVVFGSSFLGSFVDGGMSVATQQALDPNVVPGDSNWYANLKKPSWNPPGFVFPIMWLLVSKPTQAMALSKLFKASEAIPWDVLALYCGHLSLGDAWNKVFFGYQCTGKGAAVITVFFAALLSSAYLFFGVDQEAGKFMLPTCGWVFIATCLNWNIYLNN
ncbi:Translocator protein [Seminavis robusta]|uniref:Translocator protein n=1 Tax=Seminavis robusta TaxID=568900 RepID=A0A9N8HZ78_9STRA|nr:Translocator protein [Seminavis robusta]|eukprot:Sro3333_g346920.1 Translocator protein (283) ;mRNA; r:2226-3074